MQTSPRLNIPPLPVNNSRLLSTDAADAADPELVTIPANTTNDEYPFTACKQQSPAQYSHPNDMQIL